MADYTQKAITPRMQWKPVHDQMIALFIAGYKVDVIAKALNRSRNTVTRVLRDPRAQKAIEVLRKRQFESIHQKVGDRLVALSEQAVSNIAETIETPVRTKEGVPAIGSKAKIHQDNVSFELLARVGFGKQQKSEDSRGLRLSPETEKKLVDGIERARKAEIEFNRAEKVDFEDITEENGQRSGTDG